MKMNRIMKMIAIAAMTLLLPLWADAQEKTIEVQNLRDVTSIVRETKDGLWLVCNNSYAQSRFTLVDETQTTAPQLELGYITGTDSTYINDFEIFRDTVYFCGQTWREKESIAIWGYFPLAGFPNVNVSYTEMGCNYLSKLDVFSIDTTTFDLHVVMVGHYSDNYLQLAYLYDIVRTAPNVFTSFSKVLFMSGGNTILRDVAVTDVHVAVTAAGMFGRLLFIHKPMIVGTTFLNGMAYYYEWFTGISNEMLLEYCTSDALVMVTKRPFENIKVHSFLSGIPHADVEIMNTKAWWPVDAKFEESTEEMDLLTNNVASSPRSVSSKIFHLDQALVGGSSLALTSTYVGEHLNSLEWLATQNRDFVASGHDDIQHFLRIYKYYRYNQKRCSDLNIEDTDTLNVIKESKPLDVTAPGSELKMRELRSFDLEKPLRMICE